MKRIGLMSDTHGDVDPRIFVHFKDVDEIWHAGDVGSIEVIDSLEKFKRVRGVYGNIDDHVIRATWPKVNTFLCEGMKVSMTHIAGKPYKYVAEAHALLKEEQPGIFVCGHSHILLVQFDSNMNCLWLNPGACGNKGFHQVKTLLRFEIDAGKIQNMEVIELGKRG
jgi:putative phosphoesterase